MTCEPQTLHAWLQKLIGEWDMEAECVMAPGDPPVRSGGRESVRAFGGSWVLCEGESEMPGGGSGTMLMTLGFDPRRQRFVGTWIGSMMAHLWVYDGALDAAGRVLTLASEGPSMTEPGQLSRYRDAIEMKSDDYRVLTSHARSADGTWQQFMTADYRRRR